MTAERLFSDALDPEYKTPDFNVALWIAERRALADAALEGPWTAGSVEGVDYGSVMGPPSDDGRYIATPVLIEDLSRYDGTAEWIADARTSLPLALDALEKVLEAVERTDRDWSPYHDTAHATGYRVAVHQVLDGVIGIIESVLGGDPA